jgi:CRISPR system Cascade subunit CasC
VKDNLYVDVHVIQTVPPSCVNRDDTGSPKTAVYGGVTRARVSSQAWKKATRSFFTEQGIRTKNLVSVIANDIAALDNSVVALDSSFAEAEARKKATAVLNAAKLINAAGTLDALFFISPAQIHAVAQLAIDGVTNKTQIQAALTGNNTYDIALYGRMVAADPDLNSDASCQVAHAISTHRVDMEFDYFTAADDASEADHAGGAMIGTVEFNSSTLYRYANIAVHDLARQVGNADAVRAVKEFVTGFAKSMPTGKKNTFANGTLPDYLLVTVRRDQPVNLVGAFERAIKSNDGYVEKSITALKEYKAKVYGKWCDEAEHEYEVEAGTFTELLNKLTEDLENDLTA